MSADHPTPYLGKETGSGSRGDDAASSARPGLARRRDKPQLSCHHCRRKKLRCDRQQPCYNCYSRSLTCVYAQPNAGPNLQPAIIAKSNIQDRLDHLERLVKAIMPDSNNQRASGPEPQETQHENEALTAEATKSDHLEHGSIHPSASELPYVEGDHWASILDDIADLKIRVDGHVTSNYMEGHGVMSKYKSPHALLLYGCPQATSRDEILAGLPPKNVVDRHVSVYFNRLDIAYCVLHGPSFLREYQEFWENLSGTPIAWVGLLFSIICMASVASEDEPTEEKSLQIHMYREKIVQCLLLAEYTNTGPYILETLTHYCHLEFAIHPDANKDLWFLLGIAVNMALRMGYHRDPSHFPEITPLQGEMRRRVWSALLLGNILITSQMGMPRLISDGQYDTAEPRNLTDTDFDEPPPQPQTGAERLSLPPSRPETEYTPALGVIAVRRITEALGAISDLRAAVAPSGYDQVMHVDRLLHEAASRIPPPLKMKSMAASVTDSPHMIMWRLFVNHLFYKGQIMLHRPYLLNSNADQDTHSYSRNACLEASLRTLDIQHILDEETQSGGQLNTMRWRVSSVMNHQFLTATMILCSMLHRDLIKDTEAEVIPALQRAGSIWLRSSAKSREAQKAVEAVKIVLSGSGWGDEIGGDRQPDDAALISQESGRMAMFSQNLDPSELQSFSISGVDPSARHYVQDPACATIPMPEEQFLDDDWMLMNWPTSKNW